MTTTLSEKRMFEERLREENRRIRKEQEYQEFKKRANEQKIRMALIHIDRPIAWLARELNTSPQNLAQRMKRDKFTTKELEEIAKIMGARYEAFFEFDDGTYI